MEIELYFKELKYENIKHNEFEKMKTLFSENTEK